jgi:hypothetical protein
MPPQSPALFQTSNRSNIWNLLVQTLKTDPVLKNAVDTWQVYDGSEEATSEPTEEDLPLLRMTPSGGPMKWLDESDHQNDWRIKLSIGVEGTRFTDLADMWSQVEVALFNGNTLLNALIPFGVIQKTLSEAAIEPRLFGQKSGLAGEGLLIIRMRIAT